LRYSFTYNTQLNQVNLNSFSETRVQKSSYYFNGNIELAGNLLHLAQKAMSAKQTETGSYTIFGSPYSQYVRADVDFRYYWQINRRQKLATRILTGAGLPYGNSNVIPYIKQFSIGGSNSIRAFPARSIGPGSYNVRKDPTYAGQTYFIDQRGDLKIEGNVEYRFDIVKILKGALFVDAGNIWLWKDDPERPGGKFEKNTFVNQVAVGSGFGLRFDLNFFVLRFDLGVPLRKPDEGWVLNKIDFASGPWRGENLLLNIAIGYPF
jgi:outer membrane protein insertion porin family